MEGFQDCGKLIDGEGNALLVHHLRNALTGVFIEGIKAQLRHFQVSLLAFHTFYPLVYLHQIVTFYQFWHQAHQLVIGMFTLSNTGCLVIGEVMQFLYKALHLGMVFLLILCIGLLIARCCLRLL